jgi:hypothetical protein
MKLTLPHIRIQHTNRESTELTKELTDELTQIISQIDEDN